MIAHYHIIWYNMIIMPAYWKSPINPLIFQYRASTHETRQSRTWYRCILGITKRRAPPVKFELNHKFPYTAQRATRPGREISLQRWNHLFRFCWTPPVLMNILILARCESDSWTFCTLSFRLFLYLSYTCKCWLNIFSGQTPRKTASHSLRKL